MQVRAFLVACLVVGCTSNETAEPAPACHEKCQDGTAVRAVRETLKLAYNLTLQGNPVGAQDETTPCPLGGSVHVFGSASSNPKFGATEVDLTYEIDACHYLSRDDQPNENYETTLSGTVTQSGTLAVQPTATTALVIGSDSLDWTGNVYDPAIDYAEKGCVLALGQSGNHVSGTWCGREFGFDL